MNTSRARRTVPVLAGVLALGGAAALTGCGTDTSAAGSPAATPTATTPTASATALSAPVGVSPATRPAVATRASAPDATPGDTAPTASAPASAAPTRGAASGCASTAGGVPAGASHRATIDVDGDGRPDTEWVTSSPGGSIRIGITTASGATFSAPWQSASPVERVVLVARPKPGAQPVILADDGRMVGLFTVLRCAIRPVTNVQGDQYSFDLGDAGTGTGVGCLGPGDLPGLTGLNLNLATTDHKHYVITRTFVNVDGTRATNGRRDTLHVTLPAGQAAVDSASAVTCGTLTMKHDGLVAP